MHQALAQRHRRSLRRWDRTELHMVSSALSRSPDIMMLNICTTVPLDGITTGEFDPSAPSARTCSHIGSRSR